MAAATGPALSASICHLCTRCFPSRMHLHKHYAVYPNGRCVPRQLRGPARVAEQIEDAESGQLDDASEQDGLVEQQDPAFDDQGYQPPRSPRQPCQHDVGMPEGPPSTSRSADARAFDSHMEVLLWSNRVRLSAGDENELLNILHHQEFRAQDVRHSTLVQMTA